MPLSLYSQDGHTLPPADAPPLFLARTPRSADSPEVRTAAVVVAWNVFQHFYPYFDVVDTDWSAVLAESLESVLRDKSAADTHRTLKRMVSSLHDGHGWVRSPVVQKTQRVCASFGRVEGKVAVLHAAVGDPLRAGDVVQKVDGRDVEEVLDELRSETSGSPHWMEQGLLGYSIITRGKPGGTVRLQIERNGTPMDVEVERRDWRDPSPQMHAPIEALAGGAWYVDLSRAPWETIEAKLDELAAAPGVVFDLRGYPKGDNSKVLRHLLTKPEDGTWIFIPEILRPDHVGPSGWIGSGWTMSPSEPHIAGNVVFLTGPGAISYAESVMGYVEGHGLGTIVGSATAGTNGNVNPFTTPGGYEITWTGMRVLKHDGRQHHGIGVTPNVVVAPSLQGVRAGTDEVFERGLALALGR